MASGQTRVEEIRLVNADDRDEWNAGQIDGLAAEFAALRNVLNRILWGVGMLLVTTLSTTITIILTAG